MGRMNNRNLLKGLFLMGLALAFGLGSFNYPLGRIERAGPGMFPLLVSSILFVLGAAMAVRSHFTKREAFYFNVRNISIIMASLAAFAFLSEYVNMIAGIVALVFISAFAGKTYSVKRNAMIAAVLVAIAFAFREGLGLQLPLY